MTVATKERGGAKGGHQEGTVIVVVNDDGTAVLLAIMISSTTKIAVEQHCRSTKMSNTVAPSHCSDDEDRRAI